MYGQNNRARRIVISGTYGVGKTTTTAELSRVTGIPMTVARGMREILPETFPGKTLEECGPYELVQLGLTRFGERTSRESQYPSFVSDGSVIHEWAYGHGRRFEGANGKGTELTSPEYDFAMRAYGEVVKRHAKRTYTDVVHLPTEFPLPEDGHRPVSEAFRIHADNLIRQTWEELGMPYIVVSGTLKERIRKIAQQLNLDISTTLEGPEQRGNGKLWYERIEDALGDPATRYFSSGYRRTNQHIYDVQVDPETGLITARVDLDIPGNWSLKDGKPCKPHFSSTDSVVVCGQMAQLLMYTQDGMTRDESNNMWLRDLNVKPGKRPIEDPTNMVVVGQQTKNRILKMGGSHWHASDFSFNIGDGSFNVTASVAYQLPERIQKSLEKTKQIEPEYAGV